MKKFLHSIGHFAKGHRLASRLLSVILSLLLIFYVVPPIIYTKAAEAIGKEDAEAAITEDADKVASPNPYLYESTSYEVTELREESVKHFRLEDGSYLAAQYPVPVHYYENGELVDIDNSLSSVSGGFYATENARIKFVKKTGGSGEIFKLQDGSTKLTLSLVDALKKTAGEIIEDEGEEGLTELQKMTSLENLTSKIIYRDILEGVDLEYVLESLNVKENIIVKERSEEYTYRFTLALNGLTAAFGDLGEILIYEGETVKYTIPAPTVYDSKGALAPVTEAWYTLVDLGNGEYSMAVTVTDEWMNSPDRAFPVTVDPTLAIINGTIKDTYISYTDQSADYGYSHTLKINSQNTVLWKFLPSLLPAGAVVSEVILGYYGSIDGASAVIGAYEINSLWIDTTSYDDNVSIGNTVIDYVTIEGAEAKYYYWNLTPLASQWFELSQCDGVALKQISYSGSSPTAHTVTLNSVESQSSKPLLTYKYTNMRGAENYWSYNSHSAGVAGVGDVNVANGALTLAIPTLTTTDGIMPYTPTLVYNSNLSGLDNNYSNSRNCYDEYFIAPGFSLNITESIIKSSASTSDGTSVSYYVYVDADGTDHSFHESAVAGLYVDDDGMQMIMREADDGTGMIITDASKTTRYFARKPAPGYGPPDRYAWYLTEIRDVAGNAIVFTYDSYYHPTVVSLRPKGYSPIEMLRLCYSGLSEHATLEAIYNPYTQEGVVFRYDNIGPNDEKCLIRVDYAYSTDELSDDDWENFSRYIPDETDENGITINATASYQYDGALRISRVTDEKLEQSIEYGWTAGGKLSSVTQYAENTQGQSITMSYGVGYTDVRTSGNDEITGTNDDVIT